MYWNSSSLSKDATNLSLLPTQLPENSVMLWLVLTEPTQWVHRMMSISPLLVISPFKATSACVPKPAQNFLCFFVLIGLFLAGWRLNMSVVGWVHCYPPLHSQTALHLVSLLPCMVKRSHRARLEIIFSEFQRHCYVWGQLKKGAPACFHI